MAREPDDVRSYLPLRPVELEVLLSLSNGERHGYAILQEAEKRSGSETMPGLVTFYRALRRMEADALIAESDAPPDPDDDERRRYYRITDLGRRVAAAEAARMAALVRAARASHLIGEAGGAG